MPSLGELAVISISFNALAAVTFVLWLSAALTAVLRIPQRRSRIPFALLSVVGVVVYVAMVALLARSQAIVFVPWTIRVQDPRLPIALFGFPFALLLGITEYIVFGALLARQDRAGHA